MWKQSTVGTQQARQMKKQSINAMKIKSCERRDDYSSFFLSIEHIFFVTVMR